VFGFEVPGCAVPGVGVDPGVVVDPGAVLVPGVVVWPAVDPAGAPAVCNDASITSPPRRRDVGPGLLDGAAVLLHWSATLVALLTLNCFVAPAFTELELIPELAVAELLPEADDPA
jgi:hypothetical protein